jgi:hypothetical protein
LISQSIAAEKRRRRKEYRRTAVRNGLELLVGSLVREPSLDVVLDGSGVVEGPRYDGDDSVRKAEGLVEALGVGGHGLEHLHRLLGLGDAELGGERCFETREGERK